MKKKTVYWIVGIVGFFLLVGIMSGGDDSEKRPTSDVKEDTTTVSETVSKPEDENWSYEESKDEMTDKMAYFATVESQNSVDFEFPYNGGSQLTLTVRKSPKYGTDVYIKISKGQFNTAIDGIPVTVRFDEDKAFKVTGTGSSDGSGDLLFLSQTKSLIQKLKNAKTMKIDVEFFQEGHRTFTFNVEGFKWEH